MANRKLPPGLYIRQYRTAGGYKRTVFCPRFTDNKGIRRTFPVIADFKDACTELQRLQKLNREGYDFDRTIARPVEPMTLFGWIDKLLQLTAHKPIGERYKHAAKPIREFFADVALESVTNLRMQEYRAHRAASGRAVGTINREVSFLKRVLELAQRAGAIATIPEVPTEPEYNERDRVASDIEYRRIMNTLSAVARDICEIVREMGFRPRDILSMTPADVDLKGNAIHMRRIRTKFGHKRPLPMGPKTQTILAKRAKGKAPDARLFPIAQRTLQRQFQQAREQLNVRDLWLYDLKATFVTTKQRAGYADKLIKEFTGHRSANAFARYSRPSDDDLKAFIGAKRQRIGSDRKTENGK